MAYVVFKSGFANVGVEKYILFLTDSFAWKNQLWGK